MIKKLISCLLCCGVLLPAAGCNPRYDKVTRSFEAMDTFMQVELYNVDSIALTGIQSQAEWYDKALSVTEADSELNETRQLNAQGSKTMSPSLVETVRQTLALCEETDGVLDVTVCPVVEAWGFYTKDYRVPSGQELDRLLPLVDYRQVTVDGEEVRFEKEGMKIDFGAVAKGRLADEMIAILDKAGADSAILNLGGTVAAYHEKPDGSLWRVGIADPDNSASHMGSISCKDKVIATSGSYERSFTGADGKTYSHIIDPKTGVPVDNGILSVTIISDSGIRADGLSTALFVMGREKAEEYRRAHPDFDYVILTEDRKAYVTAGVSDSFKLADGSDYETVLIK